MTTYTCTAQVCKRITGRLNTAIAKQEDVSVQLEALDILADLLTRFGTLLVSFHEAIREALLPQLASPRLAVRKRTIQALGHLVMSCHHTVYVKIMEHLLEGLVKNTNTSTTRTYIQAVGAIWYSALKINCVSLSWKLRDMFFSLSLADKLVTDLERMLRG